MAEKTQKQSQKRRRPSAKETRARMAQAVGTESPMSRAEAEVQPEKAAPETFPSLETASAPTQETAVADGGGAEAAATRVPIEEKLVRLSVDVPRSQHRFLRVEAAQAGTTGMAVVRELITIMQNDPELADRIRDRLARG